MNLMRNITLGIVKLALVIGVAGGLADLTLSMKAEAIKAHKVGLISLRQLNSTLTAPIRNQSYPPPHRN